METKTMFVTPRAGLTVRDPVTKEPLPIAGAEVPPTSYWQRRVKTGDVIAADGAKEARKPLSAKHAAKPAAVKES